MQNVIIKIPFYLHRNEYLPSGKHTWVMFRSPAQIVWIRTGNSIKHCKFARVIDGTNRIRLGEAYD